MKKIRTTVVLLLLAITSSFVSAAAGGQSGTTLRNTWTRGTDGSWYYFGGSGSILSSTWMQDTDGSWYYLGDSGKMLSSTWLQGADGSWYYLSASGRMLSNQWVGNYYLGSSGAMLTNTTTPDGYQVGADGAWIQNETPTPPSKSITDQITWRYSANSDYSREYSYNGIRKAYFTLSSDSAIIDRGSYYEVPNTYIGLFDGTSDESAINLGQTTFYVKKDATIRDIDSQTYAEFSMSAQSYYNAYGSFLAKWGGYDSGTLWSYHIEVDGNGYITEIDVARAG